MNEILAKTATFFIHLGIYALNGTLFTGYQLWWNVDKLLTLSVVALILLYFDPVIQRKASFAPRRYGRGGNAAVMPRTAQAMTAATALLWFVASFLSEPPIPIIGAVMWMALVAGLLVMPQEQESLLWRCKSAILTYALAVIGFRLYLWQVNSLSPDDWARILGSSGDAQAILAQNKGMFTSVASWFLWLLAPLAYLSLLVQRFTVNPMAMVSPFRSAADIFRDIRTRGER